MSPITVFGLFPLPITLRLPTPCSDLTAPGPTAPSSQSHTFCHSRQFQPLSRQFHALPSQKLAVSQWSATQTAPSHTPLLTRCGVGVRFDVIQKKKKKKKKRKKKKRKKKLCCGLISLCVCVVCVVYFVPSSLSSLCLDLCV